MLINYQDKRFLINEQLVKTLEIIDYDPQLLTFTASTKDYSVILQMPGNFLRNFSEQIEKQLLQDLRLQYHTLIKEWLGSDREHIKEISIYAQPWHDQRDGGSGISREISADYFDNFYTSKRYEKLKENLTHKITSLTPLYGSIYRADNT